MKGAPASDRPNGDAVSDGPGGDVATDRAVLSRHGRSFRFAGRLLGPALFDRAAGLYAACRAIDDLADELPDREAARRILCDLRDDLRDDSRAARRRTPLGTKLHALRVDRHAAAALVETVLSDLEPVRIADEPALLRYSYGVAGTVGLMMCDVLGAAEPAARRHAVALGIAMQLTNIARDVREDALRDRIYLPATWLWEGAVPADLLCADPERIFGAVRRLLALAERHYEEGTRGLAFLDRRAALAISMAAARYRAIGGCILRRGPAYLSAPRSDVSGVDRCLLTLRCAVTWLVPGGGPDRERAANVS